MKKDKRVEKIFIAKLINVLFIAIIWYTAPVIFIYTIYSILSIPNKNLYNEFYIFWILYVLSVYGSITNSSYKIIISEAGYISFKFIWRKKSLSIYDIIEITGGVITLTFKYKDKNNKIKKIYVINQFGDKLEELIRELDAKNPNIQHDDIKYLKPWF